VAEPPTPEQLAQLRRVVSHAQVLGAKSVGGVPTDTLVWLLEQVGAWAPELPNSVSAKGT
jgi:hypothetical protein